MEKKPIIDKRTHLRCFISHPWASHIHHFALRLTGALRERGIEVWIDEEQMAPGQTIASRQRNGILCETDIFVVVLAPATLNSKHCMEELETAINAKKPTLVQSFKHAMCQHT